MLLLALYFIFTPGGDDGETNPEGEPAPQINPGISIEYPEGDEFVIGTNQGGVTVKNFYKTAKEIVDQTETIIEETKDYLILYHALESNFDIYFLSKISDFESALMVAENAFLSRVGVSKANACKLGVRVNIPYGIALISGGSHPLSFCPALR